jgi:hypothetical protein
VSSVVTRLAAAAGLVALACACGSDFAPKSSIQTIRILATRADLPYAHPGETVKLEVLAVDGRTNPAKKPMRVFWFPSPCVNPPGDLYYVCYAAVQQLFPVKTDLSRALVESTKTSIAIPANALDGVVAQPGATTDRTVTAYTFVAACAGHLERVPLRGGLGLNQLPVGCFDDVTGQQLGPEDFVFAFTRVFVFDARRNAIPRFDGLTDEGQPLDLAKGIVVARCTAKDTATCATRKLGLTFSDAVSELDPDITTSTGAAQRETIYVDWFTSLGKFRQDRKILFDGQYGRPPKSEAEFEPSNAPAKGTIWAIFHDNRGGTSWVDFPIEVQ